MYFCFPQFFINLKYYFTLLLFLIASALSAKDFPMESFKKLDKLGISVTPECGVYSEAVSVSFKNKTQFTILFRLGNSDTEKFQVFKTPITLRQNTCIQVKLESANAPKSIFVGTFVVGRNHSLPFICLKVNPKEFFPPTGIYDGKLIPSSSSARSISRLYFYTW